MSAPEPFAQAQAFRATILRECSTIIPLGDEDMAAFNQALANPPEPNEELRKLMTQHSSDMVERVREAIEDAVLTSAIGNEPFGARAFRAANAALEASHHAELVEALWSAKRLIENINEFGNVTDIEFVDEASSLIGSALALISGDTREELPRPPHADLVEAALRNIGDRT